MPCDQERTITVNFQAVDLDVFVAACKALGWQAVKDVDGRVIFWTRTGVGQLYQGQLALEEQDAGQINRIKQAYSRETLQAVANKYGWRLQGQGTQYTLQKRGL